MTAYDAVLMIDVMRRLCRRRTERLSIVFESRAGDECG